MTKVVFKKMSLEDNINFIKDCFYDTNDELLSTHTFTIKLFPELKNVLDSISLQEKDLLIKNIVTKYYNNNSLDFDNDIERYNNIWAKYNDDFFIQLTDFFNMDWPKEHDIIEAYVGIVPVCPRYLESFSFSVCDGITAEQLIETCTHELCHFLWFQKWKKLYPKCPRKEYESPYIVWQYSEAVVDPVLEASGIKRLINSDNNISYDIFYENYDNLMDKLFKIYNDDINIDIKIKEGFNIYKESLKRYKNILDYKNPN